MNFRTGELAVFAVATTAEGLLYVGEVVEVVAVGPWPEYPELVGREYQCRFEDDKAFVYGWQLRKLDPPTEPDALVRTHNLTEDLEA